MPLRRATGEAGSRTIELRIPGQAGRDSEIIPVSIPK